MCEKQLMRIDSKFRQYGTFSEYSIRSHYDVKYQSINILSMEFPNSIYPISASRGTNYLAVDQNGTTFGVTIPEGNYNHTDFATQLQTLLNAAPLSNGAYTITYDGSTAKLTITNIVNIALLFTQSFYINTVLGFDSTDTAFALSHTSDYIINLSGPDYINVDIQPLSVSPRIISTNGSTGVFTIPLNAPFGSVNFFEANGLGYKLSVSNGTFEVFRNIKITLYDEYGRIPDLNSDWSMLLSFE